MEINYSIDKARFRVELRVTDVWCHLDILKVEPNCKYYQKYSIKEYRHNFNFEDYNIWGEKCSFWLGVHHNSKSVCSDTIDVVVEYNPNKCVGAFLLDYILDKFFRNNPHVQVRKIDVAVDIPVNILRVKPIKDRRDMTIIDKGSDNRTYYVGAPGSDGRIKIYNKSRESKLSYDLTRYEITICPKFDIDSMVKGYKFDSGYLLDIVALDCLQMDFDMKGQDYLNLFACMDNPGLLSLLDKRKAKKIKDMLSSIGSVEFDTGTISSTIVDFLKTIYTL